MPDQRRCKGCELIPPVLHLYVEIADDGFCMGHIPTLPGFCFRSQVDRDLEAEARLHLATYARWLKDHDGADLIPSTLQLTRNRPDALLVREVEQVDGAPVWESGNAAALFSIDHQTMSDDAIRATFRFVRLVLDEIRVHAAPLPSDQRVLRPTPERRSLNETLEHIGNCIWWYASRIDDALPEPPDVDGEDPLDRIDRLFDIVLSYMLSLPVSERARVHIPERYPTRDPSEPWTHAKVCRREAEHVWAHLGSLDKS